MNNGTRISFSTKVSLLSFILCCGVVSLHVKRPVLTSNSLVECLDFYVFLLQTCVPCFFMLSGYLFFRNYQSNRWKSKLVSRIKSLLLPYLIWNVIYTFYLFLISYLGFYDGGGKSLINSDLCSVLVRCFNSDYSPLWFIKYLMAFVVISPLMYYLLRSRLLGGVIIFVLLGINAWNYYSGAMHVPLHVNANNWIMFIYQYIFFAVGAYGALCYKDFVEGTSKNKSIISTLMLVALIGLYWCYIRINGDVISNHSFRILWGVSLWFTLDFLPEIKVRPWMKYSFFIYCAHTIMIQPIQGITRTIFNDNIVQCVEYIVLPVLVISILIKIADILKSRLSLFWTTITGGRG